MNEKLRVVDFIAQYLHDEGVRVVFMLSGTGSVYIDDAFAVQKGIRYICARHEAAATIMAMSSAKLSNEIGVVIATTGPGGSNAIGGVVEAWVDSAPVLVISGQVATNQISPGVRSFGVQGFNIIENVSEITKYAAQIIDPQSTQMHLQKAIHCATTGRPGPVWLDIPMDIQAAEVNLADMPNYVPPVAVNKKSSGETREIYNALFESKKPLVVFGQGIRQSNAIGLLVNFLDDIKLPAIAARMGVDILGDENPYYFGLGGVRGTAAAAEIMKSADFVLAIGTSFTHAFAGAQGEYFSRDTPVAMINIDQSEFSKPGVSLDMSLKMDASQFLNDFSNIQSDYKKSKLSR